MDTGSEARRILLVEDEKNIRDAVAAYLERAGYWVTPAADGQEAVDAFSLHQFDLVILDLMLPRLPGEKVCRIIRDTSDVPIIMLTAKNAVDDQIECYKAGAESYIAKPFEMKILQARIDNLLQSREQSRQSFRSKMEINISNLNYQTSDEEFLNNAMQCVERHIQESEFDTVQMANELHISRSTLSRKCKVISGCTPLEFIRNIKLKYACALLKKKTISISEVAYATGFSSPKYFTKCFKEEFGMTPTEYQSQ